MSTIEMDNISKDGYLKALLVGRPVFSGMVDVAFIYWHSGIPLEKAKGFMDRYQRAMDKGRPNTVRYGM